jgi:tripartite-type tricarboxylate transporter receptor subunit TctC
MRLHLLTALAAAALLAAPAHAQYPNQPIKLISPFPPGGSVDITSRLIAEPWGKRLGQSMVVENRSGASGNVGMEAAAKAKPDGYTVVLNTISLVTNIALFPKLPYDVQKDFVPIGMVATGQHVLVANPKVAAKNMAELTALAKAQPGKLNYASAGGGTTFHLAAELYKDMTQTFITHVPYRGGGPALVDTIGGQVDFSFPVLSAGLPHVRAGTLKALAVSGTQRSPLLPDVPTMAEAGVKGYEFTTWFVVLAPAGTPPDVVQKLNSSLNDVLNSAEMRARFAREGFDAKPGTPAQAGQFVQAETARWSKLIKARGITAE